MSNVYFGIIPDIKTYHDPYEVAGNRACQQVYCKGSNVVVCTNRDDTSPPSEQFELNKSQLAAKLRAEYFEDLEALIDQLVHKQFRTIGVDDDLVFTWVKECFDGIPVFYGTTDHVGTCLDPCGDSLIPPDSARGMIERLTVRSARVDADERGELERLIALLRQAVAENRWAICFGV